MKETFYFQHDYNARNDPKLQDVLIDLGVEGIGVFWCIIEQLYEQGGTLPIRSCKSIAFALHVDCNVVERLVHDYGLFKMMVKNVVGKRFEPIEPPQGHFRQTEVGSIGTMAAKP